MKRYDFNVGICEGEYFIHPIEYEHVKWVRYEDVKQMN